MKVLMAVDGSADGSEAVRQAGRLLSAARDQVALYFTPPEVRDPTAAPTGRRTRAAESRSAAELVERLAAIPHVRRLRVHTRLPIVIPQRVCDGLLAWLRGTRLTPVVVVHANHPAELDVAVAEALARLVDAGVPVLNQSVLLRGVNDTGDVLAELCERLVDLRVLPYYLHQMDRVAGAAHFDVPLSVGRRLVDELRRRLPGYAVPRYVQEVAGEPYKVPLT